VIGAAALAGLRDPTIQMWSRSEGLHVVKPLRFWCGHHEVTERDSGPVELLELPGTDRKAYRVGQCRRCGDIFWGVRGEPSPSELRFFVPFVNPTEAR
jgi:hypothetical protein